jgi:class 3 adenylate cyclase
MWGGDVIKFAGDAMLIVFDCPSDDPEALTRATLQAAQCSKELHEIEASAKTVDNVQLSLHIGLAAGIVRFAFVGGTFRKWTLVLFLFV